MSSKRKLQIQIASQMTYTEYLKNNNKLNQLFRKIKKGILPSSFYEHSITITSKTVGNITRKL